MISTVGHGCLALVLSNDLFPACDVATAKFTYGVGN